jgi:hypothetical protein
MSEKNANIVHAFDEIMKIFLMIVFGLVLIVLAIAILIIILVLLIAFTELLLQVIKSAWTVLIDIWKCFLYLSGMEILFILIIFAFFALKLVKSMFCIFFILQCSKLYMNMLFSGGRLVHGAYPYRYPLCEICRNGTVLSLHMHRLLSAKNKPAMDNNTVKFQYDKERRYDT